MKTKQKTTQLILISIGLFLILATYFYYPKINKIQNAPTVQKDQIEEEIKKLEDKKQLLADKIKETQEYLSGDDLAEIKKLKDKKQLLVNKIKEAQEYSSDRSIEKKDLLEKIQTDLDKTSSLIKEKESSREVKKKFLEKIQTDLDKTSSLIKEKESYLEKVEQTIVAKRQRETETISDSNKINEFENIQYKGLYNLENPFEVRSEKAHILSENPDLVYMTDMRAILYLTDGRTVNIRSDIGTYNKVTYDCIFEKNVRATDEETTITSDNLDLIATDNYVDVYNNVNINYPTGSLKADKVNYDFNTRYFKISMFDDRSVKIKVLK